MADIKIVRCEDLADLVADAAPLIVCDILAAVTTDGGPALATTKLVGADCKTYSIPATPVDLNVTNFAVNNTTKELELTDEDGSVFKIPLSSLFPVIKKCDGANFDATTDTVVTCSTIKGYDGAPLDLTTAKVVQASDIKKCDGTQLDLAADKIPTCADLDALKTQVADLLARLTTIETTIAAADTLTDCDGVPLAKVLKV